MKPWLIRAAVAVLTVALGIGIGAGPLQHSNKERDKQLAAQKAKVVREQRTVESLRASAAFADAFATATGPTLTRGALAGRSIALVTLPGADPKVVDRLKAEVAAAQGQITAEVALAAAMGRSSSRQLVEALTSQMLTQAGGLEVPADAGGYGRFGALLARAVGTGPTGQPAQAAYDATAAGIVSGLQSADLVNLPQPESARAGLALVVAGPAARTDAAGAQNAVPVTILRAFGSQLPTVVVGSTASAGSRGLLGALRASDTRRVVSTVDSVETAMGQVAGVLALAARAQGTIGQYGAVGAADGPIPGAKH
ncbi:hypothetical protein ACVW00_002064 [Marmoricola sp. URHA0025 HA25]